MMKKFIKIVVGKVRAKFFGVTVGKNVYIGNKCNLKGGKDILLGDSVTIRPYVQIWSGGE